MQASTTLSVGGVSLTRTTGQAAPGHANGANATKNWVGAKIAITPDATNEVGQPHTFTVTLSKDTGSGFVAAAGEHVDFTLTDSNGASSSAADGHVRRRGCEHERVGSVHDHVHVEHGRQGDRARDVDAAGRWRRRSRCRRTARRRTAATR